MLIRMRGGVIRAKEKSFFGYKVHTVADESRIVTSVETFPGNENEGTRLLGILKEDEAKGIEAEGVVADKLYDSANNRKGARELGLTSYILSRTKKRRLDHFDFDVTTGVLSCPVGVEPAGRREGSSHSNTYPGTGNYHTSPLCP